MSDHSAFKRAIEELEAVFQEAASHRKERPDFVEDGAITVPEWVIFEREQMHTAVNVLRAERGKGPIPVEIVARVEQMASGHVDYSHKYPLYCAELAFDRNPLWQP